MKCLLMNKNTEVLLAEYDTTLNGFSTVYEVLNINFAPLIIKKQFDTNPDDLPRHLSKWFRNRGIPSWRDQLDLLLLRLGVQTPEELLNKSFGLSLSDQYWLKPSNSDIEYASINFFDHSFDSADFLDASFSNAASRLENVSLYSPNNTTDGMLKKTWVTEGDKRYLLKGGFKGDSLQPFNEVLATKICERLDFPHVSYILDAVKGNIVSKCECITTKNTEIIPAYQILFGYETRDSFEDYEAYIELLEDHDISSARKKLEDVVILDFLIMNEDRHLNNFGVIRNVETLEWLDVMPIFDNGQALNILSYGNGEIKISGEGRFFHNVEKFDNMIRVVHDFSRFDFSKLDGLVDEFKSLLTEYKDPANLSTDRISALSAVLSSQINKILQVQSRT